MIQRVKDFVREREVGGYNIILPEPPDKMSLIDNYNLKKENQKFIRTELPKDFNSWSKEDKKKFRDKEFYKRIHGYWFYNNGNIEYITGINYFYINWWRIDTGFPMFVDSDRDFFYIWDMVEKDPKCDGLVYITNRGDGKTHKSNCIVYNSISMKFNVQAGIQSKTESDAKKIFNKLIFSWSKLPAFFKPIDTGSSRPSKILEFVAPQQRDGSQDKEASDVLNSSIDYASSGVSAYDGQTLHRVFHDEIGKCIECSVDERMNTVRECLRAGRGVYGRGKIIATTTVEEMLKKGGKECKKVWDKANPNERDSNGFTKNGLYRYFKPSNKGYLEVMNGEDFVDEYGYSKTEKALNYFLEKRKALKGSDLSSEKRKFPLYEKDVWISDSKKSVYDTVKIDEQLAYNDSLVDSVIQKGDFKWKDGIKDTEVYWYPSEEGKWKVTWMPPIELRNRKMIKNGVNVPGNTDLAVFGLDPYDQNITVSDTKSNAASYGIRKFDPMNPDDTGIFCCEYVNRPHLADIMFEDMIMQCVFYGSEILIESNKIGCISYFSRRGYQGYLMMRPEETKTSESKKVREPGIPMSGGEARQALVYATEAYIINKVGLIEEEGRSPYMGRCYFSNLLNDWREFDFDTEWTKFDCMVGAGLALLAARKYIPKKYDRKAVLKFDMFDVRTGRLID